MLSIRHAILHAFDFETGSVYLSEHELDMDEKLVKSFVRRHLRRCAVSERNMHGEFADNSGFAEELGLYGMGRMSFLELSKEVAEVFWETLRTCDDLVQADLLVADFEQSAEAPSAEADEEEVQRAYDGKPTRSFAVVLLPRKQTFMHSIEHPVGGAFNEIVRHDATLPNPSMAVDTYAVVDLETMAIDYSDHVRTIAEAEVWVVQNLLLKCSCEPSSHSVIKSVEQIVQEVAEVGGANVVEAVSRAKACVAHSAEVDERLEPQAIGRQVFTDDERLQERYEDAVGEAELPQEVTVRRAAARRLTKMHRIRTDTGIDIAFPSEYSRSPEHLEFVREEDGSTTIVIRNVRSIENR